MVYIDHILFIHSRTFCCFHLWTILNTVMTMGAQSLLKPHCFQLFWEYT